MNLPLPSKRFQRKKRYLPKLEDVIEAYDLLNTHIFDNKLARPSINLRTLKVWGVCIGFTKPTRRCKIKLHKQFFCIQWMITILAHEMCHQAQWDLCPPFKLTEFPHSLLEHNSEFYQYKDKLASFGIPLQEKYPEKKWLKEQKF